MLSACRLRPSSEQYIGGVQPIPWDSKDKDIFAMLDELIIADEEKPLLNSTNMAAMP